MAQEQLGIPSSVNIVHTQSQLFCNPGCKLLQLSVKSLNSHSGRKYGHLIKNIKISEFCQSAVTTSDKPISLMIQNEPYIVSRTWQCVTVINRGPKSENVN